MSLIRQLWLAIALVALIAFGGSAVISAISARAYVTEQLLVKNLDNAGALGAVLSQMPKDPVTVELLISAQFDTGHYELIRLEGTAGEVIVERRSDAAAADAPDWFRRLVPIEVPPGVAQVQDGWRQYGTLTLSSQVGYARAELWNGVVRLSGWFLAAALLTGMAGTVLLRFILRPLDRVVEQAEAIAERRFVVSRVPRTAEFGRVVRSMNALSERVERMLDEESRRLERLRVDSHYDAATGLLNREHFLARSRVLLEDDDAGGAGVLLMVRLVGLATLNRRLGRAVVDTLIVRLARALIGMNPPDRQGAHPDWICGRLNGAEFALLAPGLHGPLELGSRARDAFRSVARELGLDEPDLAIGAVACGRGEALTALLARADVAVALSAEQGGAVMTAHAGGSLPEPTSSNQLLARWRALLEPAFESGGVRLEGYPVISVTGELLHEECFGRVRLEGHAEWLTAGQFLPWLMRLDMGTRLDDRVVDLALERLRTDAVDICINLSAQSLEEGWLGRVATRLGAATGLRGRLLVEVPEYAAFRKLEQFRLLCSLLGPLGCRVGIEHVGHQVARIGELRELGIDYVKVDAPFVHDIDTNAANQLFLQGLATIAHAIGLEVIAEGVASQAALAAVFELGFDGATGPAARLAPA